MKLLKASSRKSGFTLIEVIVTLGILTVIMSLGLLLSMDFYRGYAFRYESNLAVSLVQKARSRAIANVNQSSHGFCWDNSEYKLFEGTSCSTGVIKERVPRSSNIAITTSFAQPEVVFAALSGESANGTVTIAEGAKNRVITLNNEGAIIW